MTDILMHCEHWIFEILMPIGVAKLFYGSYNLDIHYPA